MSNKIEKTENKTRYSFSIEDEDIFNVYDSNEQTFIELPYDLVTDENVFEYTLESIDERATLIEDLFSQSSQSDRVLMRADLKELYRLDNEGEEYILLSVRTNEFLAPNKNPTKFDRVMEEIIDQVQEINSKNNLKL